MGEAEDDNYKWLRLFATVTAVALGSSLQFGFATGSLNNLEQIVPETWRRRKSSSPGSGR